MRRICLIPVLVLVAATSGAAKDWRGILPMHSTREDVEAALGPPEQPPEGSQGSSKKSWSVYHLDEGEIYFAFTDEDSLARSNCHFIAANVVSVIRVTPKNEMLLTDLKFNEKSFRKFDASDVGHEGFIDEKDGLVIRTLKGKVQEVVYVASASDRQRCPDFYDDMESLVRINKIACFLRFDSYGNIRFSDEKARLDNFAIQLLNEQKALGYILVYAGRKATVAEAQTRANRARDYLISVREISPERIKTVDGGHVEDLTVELHIVPANADPPSPMPTVDPKEVEIIYEKKRRSRGKRH